MALEITHSPTQAVATRDGNRLGELNYRIDDQQQPPVWTLYSTHVDPKAEGQGVGSALVGEVIARIDEAGAKVVPTCWFVDGWLDRHPDFQHLRVG